ncbi:hypothetical protein PROFUN_06832 [Planoprotostelium fungivorum]|uniref:Uncharacterized protein n=1 Tax=Planoprotostelium fungivorum TaxID=1890364 RepID=A0A2P6NNB7_9EUKA|nr:hypothetical protein PROFUN_06832 [Planoprotostelium fungivorum]
MSRLIRVRMNSKVTPLKFQNTGVTQFAKPQPHDTDNMQDPSDMQPANDTRTVHEQMAKGGSDSHKEHERGSQDPPKKADSSEKSGEKKD